MSNSVTAYQVSGWHTKKSGYKEFHIDDFQATKFNIFKVMGYVPGTGILSGFADIDVGLRADDLITRIYLVVRGILEIIGLGILFIIPDAIVSYHRHFYTSKPLPVTLTF